MGTQRVTIIGTGQMAVMCARLLGDNGHQVTLVGRGDTVWAIQKTRRSPQMPDIEFDPKWELKEEVSEYDGTMVDVIVIAIPTQSIRTAFDQLVGARLHVPQVCCAKGIEIESGMRASTVAAECLASTQPNLVLSGPNIATEVVARKPAGTVLACKDMIAAERIRELFATDYFRVYTSDDVVGVELAGALKNVIAIAAGIVDGLDLGNNAKAALVTRGIVEITRLGTALGAKAETFAGLAGMGDLITTCISPEGRNRRVGEMIGQGLSVDAALAKLGSVCEGVPTTQAVVGLAAKHDVDMPIATAIHGVLFEGKPVKAALLELMTREPKSE